MAAAVTGAGPGGIGSANSRVAVPSAAAAATLTLDLNREANYAGPVSRRDGFFEATSNPHPEATVRILSPRLAVMIGHRAGHSPPRVPIEMTGSVSGDHGAHAKKPMLWISGMAASPPRTMPRRLSRLLMLSGLMLSGCHLLDQTDFQPKPPAPPVVPPVPDPETRAALLTIDFARPDTDYRSAVAGAIHIVEARRPGVLYDVVGVVQDMPGLPAGRARAAEVMTAIEAAGVNPARVQLGITLDPARKIPQVRVYLR